MIAAFSALGASIARAREWLVLLAVAAAGAYFYASWAQLRVERDRLAQWAEVTCSGAGAPFAASTEQRVDTGGKARTVTFAQGQRCRTAVSMAVAFRADTERATAAALAKAMQERDARAATDAQLARAAAESTRDVLTRMEIADAEAERRNRVDHDWFAALNDLAGLRAPHR